MCCCATKIAKILLIAFNIGFFLIGGLALAVGIWVLVDQEGLLGIVAKVPSTGSFDVETVINSASFLQNGAYILIAVGGFIFIIGFCGLCGAMQENKTLLLVYASLVFVILALEIAAAVLCLYYGDEVKAYLLTWISTLITDYYYGATLGTDNLVVQSVDSTGISEAIDLLQVQLKCCGASNYTDYNSTTSAHWTAEYNITMSNSTVYTITDAVVPISCCKIDNPSAWPSSLDTLTFTNLELCLTTGDAEYTNLDSCYTTLKALLVEYADIALIVGLVIAGVELLGILAACCLYANAGKDD